jgi:acid stress-induced BolA-like protein IbaG/YrbA
LAAFSLEIDMTEAQLEQLISGGLICSHLQVQGDGRHWYAVVVSDAFAGMRPIARHQKVYATLGDRMKTDEVHALSIKAFTPAEWAEQTTA